MKKPSFNIFRRDCDLVEVKTNLINKLKILCRLWNQLKHCNSNFQVLKRIWSNLKQVQPLKTKYALKPNVCTSTKQSNCRRHWNKCFQVWRYFEKLEIDIKRISLFRDDQSYMKMKSMEIFMESIIKGNFISLEFHTNQTNMYNWNYNFAKNNVSVIVW